jgi:hypothetical protein
MSCDCESPSAYSSTSRRARKAHLCYECGTGIAPGETYRYVSGIWDGSPSSYHFHTECDLARHQFEALVRETQKVARARLRAAERAFGSFVGSPPPRTTTAAEDRAEILAAQRATDVIGYVCDCVCLGGLDEAMHEYALEVLGYDTRTGQPPVKREWLGVSIEEREESPP